MAITANPERGGSSSEPNEKPEKEVAIPKAGLKKAREKAQAFILGIKDPRMFSLGEIKRGSDTSFMGIYNRSFEQFTPTTSEVVSPDDMGLKTSEIFQNREFVDGFTLIQRFVKGIGPFFDGQEINKFASGEINVNGIFLNREHFNKHKNDETGLALVQFAESVLINRQPNDDRGLNRAKGIRFAAVVYTQAVMEYINPLLDQFNKNILG